MVFILINITDIKRYNLQVVFTVRFLVQLVEKAQLDLKAVLTLTFFYRDVSDIYAVWAALISHFNKILHSFLVHVDIAKRRLPCTKIRS